MHTIFSALCCCGYIINLTAISVIFTRIVQIRQAIIWTHDGLGWVRIYASLGLNELSRDVTIVRISHTPTKCS